MSSFQSTRPRGARHRAKIHAITTRPTFQSTRPRGARHQEQNIKVPQASVSIHAPAGGATSGSAPRCACPRGFNPRARGGRDLVVPSEENVSGLFQSTRPRGARPRQRAGFFWRSFRVSIHAPAGGATGHTLRTHRSRRCFNPRARGGRDRLLGRGARSGPKCFNPRARGGRDPSGSSASATRHSRFNPRARGGRDPVDLR